MKHGKETCVWKVVVSSAKASILSSESWFSPNNSSWLFSLLLSQLLLVRIRSSAEPTCVCREWLVDVLIELRTAQTWSNLYFHKASVAAALLPLFTKGFYYWCILQLLRALYDVLYTSFSNGIVPRRWFTLKKKALHWDRDTALHRQYECGNFSVYGSKFFHCSAIKGTSQVS